MPDGSEGAPDGLAAVNASTRCAASDGSKTIPAVVHVGGDEGESEDAAAGEVARSSSSQGEPIGPPPTAGSRRKSSSSCALTTRSSMAIPPSSAAARRMPSAPRAKGWGSGRR